MTGTLVYDADCGFCARCAAFARARLAPGNRVIASHAVGAAAGLSRSDLDAAAWWLPDDGAPLRGHLAVAAALQHCRRGWPLLGRLAGARDLAPVSTRVYALVAANRYRLPGSDGTCSISD